MANKSVKPTSFRFDEPTNRTIDWLTKKLNMKRIDVIRMAVVKLRETFNGGGK
jgi:hypothetical protein